MRVLVVAAHPDDETLGVGGTMARHAGRGDEVFVLIATDGVTARHEQKEPQRAAARRACKVLGVRNVEFLDLPDQRLDKGPLVDVIDPLTEAIKKVRPRVVYTHHWGDVNQDHRTLFEASLVAVRPKPRALVRRVLCYEVPSSTEWSPSASLWSFEPDTFVDVGDTLDRKLEALEVYRDTHEAEIEPFPHPRSPDAVRAIARRHGSRVGLAAAEAFSLVRDVRTAPSD